MVNPSRITINCLLSVVVRVVAFFCRVDFDFFVVFWNTTASSRSIWSTVIHAGSHQLCMLACVVALWSASTCFVSAQLIALCCAVVKLRPWKTGHYPQHRYFVRFRIVRMAFCIRDNHEMIRASPTSLDVITALAGLIKLFLYYIFWCSNIVSNHQGLLIA